MPHSWYIVLRKHISMKKTSSASRIPRRADLTDDLMAQGVSFAQETSGDAFEVVTVAGSGRIGGGDGAADRATFASPGATLQLRDGSLLVSDTGNNRLRRLVRQPDGGVSVTTICAKAGWLKPKGLAVLRDGSVIVCDSGHNKLRRIDPDDGWSVSTWAGNGAKGHRDGGAANARFDGPSGVSVCPDGTVLVADTGNHCVRAIAEQDGRARAVRTLAGSPGLRGHRDEAAALSRFDAPVSIVAPAGATGPLYVADAGSHTLRCISGSEGGSLAVNTLAGCAGRSGHRDGALGQSLLSSPTSLCVMGDGRLLIADTGSSCLRCVCFSTRTLVTVAGSVGGRWGAADGAGTDALLNTPTGLASGAASEVWLADAANHTVRLMRPAPTIATMGPSPASVELLPPPPQAERAAAAAAGAGARPPSGKPPRQPKPLLQLQAPPPPPPSGAWTNIDTRTYSYERGMAVAPTPARDDASLAAAALAAQEDAAERAAAAAEAAVEAAEAAAAEANAAIAEGDAAADDPPLSPPRQPAAGSYPGSPEAALLHGDSRSRIAREAAAPQRDDGAPLDGPGFTGEAQLFSRPAPMTTAAAAGAATETDGAEPSPAADEMPWKYVGAASVELGAFEPAAAPGGAAAAMVRVTCRSAPSQATVLTRRAQLTVREGCFVCFAARAAGGAPPAELGLRFRSREAVRALLGAFDTLLAPATPRADPTTHIVNVAAHATTPARDGASATQALHAEARKLRAAPLSPSPSPSRERTATPTASPTSRASLLPREDVEAMRKQQQLQRRAEAAELEAQRLGAQLADAQGDAIRLRHQLEEVQAQLLARDAKIAALTRRQLLAANVRSPGK